MHNIDVLLLDDCLWLVTQPIGMGVYDFDFHLFFDCKHPWERPKRVDAVARLGAFDDYGKRYEELLEEGIQLIHSPEEFTRSSELPGWYPPIEDLTPRSICFDHIPRVAEVTDALAWPIFVKGHRQTSRHKRSLAIIEGPERFQRAMEAIADDRVLGWQKIVCREFVPLRPVEDPSPDRIPSAFEFRTFWWREELVGCGRYWWEGPSYDMCATEYSSAVAVATEAARRVGTPFLVVDIAQTVEGDWIVIECNDGQESGYAGVAPFPMWQKIVEIERRRERS